MHGHLRAVPYTEHSYLEQTFRIFHEPPPPKSAAPGRRSHRASCTAHAMHSPALEADGAGGREPRPGVGSSRSLSNHAPRTRAELDEEQGRYDQGFLSQMGEGPSRTSVPPSPSAPGGLRGHSAGRLLLLLLLLRRARVVDLPLPRRGVQDGPPRLGRSARTSQAALLEGPPARVPLRPQSEATEPTRPFRGAVWGTSTHKFKKTARGDESERRSSRRSSSFFPFFRLAMYVPVA
jgi:hypothetical protein